MKFEQILVIATIITGTVYFLDKLVLAKNRAKDKEPNVIIEFIKSIFPIFILVLFLRSFLAEPFRVPTGSMKPTVLEGDFIIVNKFKYGLRVPITGQILYPLNNPKRGDIMVFRHFDGTDLIKRVVGLPGDKVVYKNQKLYINDKLVETKLINSNVKDVDVKGKVNFFEEKTEFLNGVDHKIYLDNRVNREFYPYSEVIVPVGEYFVMGDNRNNSGDSRYWGFVKNSQIIGKAFATWFSWDSNGNSFLPIRWSRIGKNIS